MEKARAATVPKKTDGTFSNCLPKYGSDQRIGEEPISLAQPEEENIKHKDGSGIVKCKTCDLHFKEYKKPQFNEIEFKDGDLHCDKCFNRIVDEKAASWKAAFPASGGILSTKRKVKVPLKMGLPLGDGGNGDVGQRGSQTRTRFSPGNVLFFVCIRALIV